MSFKSTFIVTSIVIMPIYSDEKINTQRISATRIWQSYGSNLVTLHP